MGIDRFLDQKLISYRESSCYCFLFLVVVLAAMDSLKSLKLRRFKLDRDEIGHDCSSSKSASIDGVRL